MIEVRLNEVLKKRKRTLYWLAKESGVSYATVWRIARGDVGRLGIDTLDRICLVLKCQPGDLMIRVERRQAKKTKAG